MMARTCLFWASILLAGMGTGSVRLPLVPDAAVVPLAACAVFLEPTLGPERPATSRAFTGALGANGSADNPLAVGGVVFALDVFRVSVERPASEARGCAVAFVALEEAAPCEYPALMIPTDIGDGGMSRGNGAPSGSCLAAPAFGRRRPTGNGGNANAA